MTEVKKPDDGRTVLTPEFRLSFPHLFVPVATDKNKPDDKKYTMSMLFAAGVDVSALKKAAAAAAKETWGDSIPKNLKSPFLDAGKYEYEGYAEGMVLVRPTSKQKPNVVGPRKDPTTDTFPRLSEENIYPGCYCRATVRAFTYNRPDSKGVSFGIQNVQFIRDGEPLGGRRKPEDEFTAVEGAENPGGDGASELFK